MLEYLKRPPVKICLKPSWKWPLIELIAAISKVAWRAGLMMMPIDLKILPREVKLRLYFGLGGVPKIFYL
ncbi:MAG: hypothetical protein QXR17_07025 [Candidatus Bathyarchaeia archaeon]